MGVSSNRSASDGAASHAVKMTQTLASKSILSVSNCMYVCLSVSLYTCISLPCSPVVSLLLIHCPCVSNNESQNICLCLLHSFCLNIHSISLSSVDLSIYLSVCLSLSLFRCFSHHHPHTFISPILYQHISVSPSLALYLSVFCSHCLSISLSPSAWQSLFLSLSLSLCLSASQYLYLRLPGCLCLGLSVSLSLILSIYLSVSFCLCLSVSITLTVSLFLYFYSLSPSHVCSICLHKVCLLVCLPLFVCVPVSLSVRPSF